MLNKFISVTIFSIIFSTSVISQIRECDTDVYFEKQIESDAKRLDIMRQIETHTQEYARSVQSRSNAVITIPVVVHIVYNNSTENLTDAHVRSQIEVLNKDFRRLNADTSNVWSQGADSGIEFCLASIDPDGKTTTGITRTYTASSSFSTTSDFVKYDLLGGKNAWPASQYLNIWVCDISGTVLGYAQFPGGNAQTDGVVIDYKYFGTGSNVSYPFHLGRTATHEVGHWLNLKHIWGGADCVTDDLVSDTPMADGPNYGCNKGHRSCNTGDMVENYMDYSDDYCMNIYTAGQKARMQSLFTTGGFRHAILSSKGCGGQKNTSTYCENIAISITFDNYPQETSWMIKDNKGNTILKSLSYSSSQKATKIKIDTCLTAGCYEFVINDAYSDGICCSYGQGSYTVAQGTKIIGSGGAFGKSKTHSFCIIDTSATCTDGIKNGTETGIDCGGSACLPCVTCSDGIQNGTETGIDCGGSACLPCATCTDGIKNGTETGIDCGGTACQPCSTGNTGSDTNTNNPNTGTGTTSGNSSGGMYFEEGWDGWIGGASDTERYTGDYAWEGDYAIMIRDNSGDESAITSPTYDLRNKTSVKIEFAFYSYSMEVGEDFWLMYHDGTKWNTLKSYVSGTDFFNSNFYEVSFTMSAGQYSFVQNGKFRFQCDASTNSDQIYIDAVKITPTNGGNKDISYFDIINTVGHYIGTDLDEPIQEISIYPNPSDRSVNILSNVELIEIKIIDMAGSLIKTITATGNDQLNIDITELNPGIYLLNMQTEDGIVPKKLVKR